MTHFRVIKGSIDLQLQDYFWMTFISLNSFHLVWHNHDYATSSGDKLSLCWLKRKFQNFVWRNLFFKNSKNNIAIGIKDLVIFAFFQVKDNYLENIASMCNWIKDLTAKNLGHSCLTQLKVSILKIHSINCKLSR